VRRKRVLYRITAILLALILAAVAAELALRAFPEALLGEDLTAALYDPYNESPFGMYFREPDARLNLMWPSQELKAYSHGYFWTHRTDARGFRNPEDRQATGILLLGDSMIYGHGVEDDQTAASFLHRDYGDPVYNMARQGDCLYQHYRLLRLYLDELKPRTVLLFAFSNDLTDLATTGALAYADRPPEIEKYDYAAIRRSIALKSKNRPGVPFTSRFVLGRLAARGAADVERPGKGAKGKKRSPVPRALRELAMELQEKKTVDLDQAKQLVSEPQFRKRLERGWSMLEEADLARAALYYARIIPDLHRRCREKGAELVLVNLALDQGEYWRANVDEAVAAMEKRRGIAATKEAREYVAGVMYEARVKMAAQAGSLIAEVAADDGIELLDLSALFTDGDNFLEDDGHLSETGHRRLAEKLHGFLSRKK